MKKQRILSLCLASLLAVSLAACKGQAEEQDSTPPTASVQPTTEPTPTPTPPIPYTDVAESAPYYDAVVWAYENGIASDGSTFEPDSACTRGQVITFMWRAAGSPEPQATESPFSDVSSADWFYSPALWAYENGIATSTTFNPGNPCTNGEALTFLWRAEGKPAAAVYSSPMALAAPDKYFTRPVAWAETNGLFAGADFDPAAPCSRADLMTYLYWVTEEWTFPEEAKTVQAEYEQIINDAQLYEVHGSGLCYADYVDVDGDGKVELLTLEIDKEKYNDIVTIYADINGHAGKSYEGTFDALVGNRVADLSLCKADGQLYLFASGWYVERAGEYYQYIDKFYRLGKDAVTLEYDLYAEETAVFDEGTYEYLYTAYTYTASDKKVSEGEFKALLEKFTDENLLYTFDVYGLVIGIEDRGLLPTAEEYQLAYWTAVNPAYAAVLKGDFSAFAGTYTDSGVSVTLNSNGVLTGGTSQFATNLKPSSITITKDGRIHCVLRTRDLTDGPCEESYDICPIGVGGGLYFDPQLGEDVIIDASKVRLDYNWRHFNITPSTVTYYKAS